MKIAIIGAGYVGLVSGVCFSDFGHEVVCVDRDAEKIEMLKRGDVPIYEPGLLALLNKNASAGRLKFTLDLAEALNDAHAVFIAVGTPESKSDGSADLSYVIEAAIEIAQLATDYLVVVIKSTVPVGTNRRVERVIRQSNKALEFDVASNPEFLREGAAIKDFMNPDRIVIGTQSEKSENLMREIYRPLSLREYPVVVTDLESAELIKYAANAFLATKVTFINEMATLCEQVGADVREVARGIGFDSRIGQKFLNAGPGYGGSCFPKDTKALAKIGRDHSAPMKITEAVIEVNSEVKSRLVDRIRELCGGSLDGKSIVVLGVTFKPETDDMRDAPSLSIVPPLVTEGAKVKVCDPQGRKEGEELLSGVAWESDPYQASEGAELVVLLTEWNEFRALNLQRLAKIMSDPVMADFRNIYNAERAREAGFRSYISFGRASYVNQSN